MSYPLRCLAVSSWMERHSSSERANFGYKIRSGRHRVAPPKGAGREPRLGSTRWNDRPAYLRFVQRAARERKVSPQEVIVRQSEPPEDDDLNSDPEEASTVEIAEEYLDRLLAGESPDREAIVAAHPDLEGRLRRRLLLMEFIWQAGN